METQITPSFFFFGRIVRLLGIVWLSGLICGVVISHSGGWYDAGVLAYIGSRPNTRWGEAQFAINAYDVRTRHIIPLTSPNLYPQVFNWSPNGEHIAFVARPYGSGVAVSQLYVMKASGQDAHLISADLTVIITSERPPYWVSDNQTVIFQATQAGGTLVQFYRGYVDGSPPQLTDLNDVRAQGYLNNLFPTYHIAPNGTHWAYIDYQQPEWVLVVIVNGMRNPLYTFTAEEIMPDAPDWSADSTRIAFSQREQGVAMIRVLSLDGADVFTLPQGRYPLWQPIMR